MKRVVKSAKEKFEDDLKNALGMSKESFLPNPTFQEKDLVAWAFETSNTIELYYKSDDGYWYEVFDSLDKIRNNANDCMILLEYAKKVGEDFLNYAMKLLVKNETFDCCDITIARLLLFSGLEGDNYTFEDDYEEIEDNVLLGDKFIIHLNDDKIEWNETEIIRLEKLTSADKYYFIEIKEDVIHDIKAVKVYDNTYKCIYRNFYFDSIEQHILDILDCIGLSGDYDFTRIPIEIFNFLKD